MRRKPRSPATRAEAAFLPEAELEVLACLHHLAQAEASEIRAALEKQRGFTRTDYNARHPAGTLGERSR